MTISASFDYCSYCARQKFCPNTTTRVLRNDITTVVTMYSSFYGFFNCSVDDVGFHWRPADVSCASLLEITESAIGNLAILKSLSKCSLRSFDISLWQGGLIQSKLGKKSSK